jgi:hypothetical protein
MKTLVMADHALESMLQLLVEDLAIEQCTRRDCAGLCLSVVLLLHLRMAVIDAPGCQEPNAVS